MCADDEHSFGIHVHFGFYIAESLP